MVSTWFTLSLASFGLFLGGTPVVPRMFWVETKALPGTKLCSDSAVKPVRVKRVRISHLLLAPSHVRTGHSSALFTAQYKHPSHDTDPDLTRKSKLDAPFSIGSLLYCHLRACPSSLGKGSLLTLPLPMDSPHNLLNSRSLSAHGPHMLLNPGRRHYHFLDLLIR
jgi:hypothetical protein